MRQEGSLTHIGRFILCGFLPNLRGFPSVREKGKNRWLQSSLSYSTVPFPRVLEKWVLGCRLLEFVKAKHILILEVNEGTVRELGWGGG